MCSLQTSTGTLLMFLVDEKMGAAAAVDDELLLVVFRRLDGGDAPPLRRRLYSLLRRINFRPNTDSAWRMSSDVHMTFSVSEEKKYGSGLILELHASKRLQIVKQKAKARVISF